MSANSWIFHVCKFYSLITLSKWIPVIQKSLTFAISWRAQFCLMAMLWFHVLFVPISKDCSILICFFYNFQKLYILGGEVAESAQKCTHLIASKVTRTVKFLTAISVVKHIVTPEWLEECFKCQKFVGKLCCYQFIIKNLRLFDFSVWRWPSGLKSLFFVRFWIVIPLEDSLSASILNAEVFKFVANLTMVVHNSQRITC